MTVTAIAAPGDCPDPRDLHLYPPDAFLPLNPHREREMQANISAWLWPSQPYKSDEDWTKDAIANREKGLALIESLLRAEVQP